ncbi:hypothetical protein ACXM0N_19965 [Peribacillus simplex]
MKTELLYFDLADDKYLFPEPITSDGFIFIPNEGDTLILNGWGYIVSRNEYSYEPGITKIVIFCMRENKKRK